MHIRFYPSKLGTKKLPKVGFFRVCFFCCFFFGVWVLLNQVAVQGFLRASLQLLSSVNYSCEHPSSQPPIFVSMVVKKVGRSSPSCTKSSWERWTAVTVWGREKPAQDSFKPWNSRPSGLLSPSHLPPPQLHQSLVAVAEPLILRMWDEGLDWEGEWGPWVRTG